MNWGCNRCQYTWDGEDTCPKCGQPATHQAMERREKGRPSKYETEVRQKLHSVAEWAADGLTNEQIAQNLGIAMSTFYEYQNNHPDFSEVLKKGKSAAVRLVENSLFKSATGYEVATDEKFELRQVYDEDGNPVYYNDGSPKMELQPVERTIKHITPNSTAMVFYLKNRDPQNWKDRKEVIS